GPAIKAKALPNARHVSTKDGATTGTPENGSLDGTALQFAVNVDPSESDLRRLDDAAIRKALGPHAVLTTLDDLKPGRKAEGPRVEFAQVFAIVVFALVMIESFLATGFGHRR